MRLFSLYILSAALVFFTLIGVNTVNAKAEYLTDFNYGVTSEDKSPTLISKQYGNASLDTDTNDVQTRNFTLIVEENKQIPITSPNATEDQTIMFPAWTFNGTVPGPTMRMTEGDHVFIKVINSEDSEHTHSLHMHSTHPPDMDGTFGPSGAIKPGESFTYEFIAGPAGVYPYHCHVEPIQDHINRGLYGAMIIDPVTPREPANEMMMFMNSYDLFLNEEMDPTARPPNAPEATMMMDPNVEEELLESMELEIERDNEFYTVNGRAFEYMDNPIEVKVGEPVRMYLLNMIEFDPVNSFHLHSGMFEYTASGTEDTPPITTDIVTIGQGDRGIIEFTPEHTGKMMVHAHINEFTQLGWMAVIEVVD